MAKKKKKKKENKQTKQLIDYQFQWIQQTM